MLIQYIRSAGTFCCSKAATSQDTFQLPFAYAFNHVQAKKFDKAVTIMGRNQWWDKLNQVVGQLPGQNDAERTALRLSAAFFRKAGQTQFAKETYVKLRDYQASLRCMSIALMVPMRPWRYSCTLLFTKL